VITPIVLGLQGENRTEMAKRTSACLAFTQGVSLRVISAGFTRSSRHSSSQDNLKALSPTGTVSTAEEVTSADQAGYIIARIFGGADGSRNTSRAVSVACYPRSSPPIEWLCWLVLWDLGLLLDHPKAQNRKRTVISGPIMPIHAVPAPDFKSGGSGFSNPRERSIQE
jgi:hypothetical protein